MAPLLLLALLGAGAVALAKVAAPKPAPAPAPAPLVIDLRKGAAPDTLVQRGQQLQIVLPPAAVWTYRGGPDCKALITPVTQYANEQGTVGVFQVTGSGSCAMTFTNGADKAYQLKIHTG